MKPLRVGQMACLVVALTISLHIGKQIFPNVSSAVAGFALACLEGLIGAAVCLGAYRLLFDRRSRKNEP